MHVSLTQPKPYSPHSGMYNLPVNDVISDGDNDIMADARDLNFDHSRNGSEGAI